MKNLTDRRAILMGGGAIMLLALLHGALFWPGIMTWDAIRQYGQALNGQYDDWHPPAMNWLWRQLGLFGAGPAPMLVLQLALYWGGTAWWMQAAWARGQRAAAGAIGLLALSPIVLVLVGTILKDSLFAGTLLLASGLLVARPGSRAARIVAALLLVAAATLRFNAVPACLPLLLLALPTAWRRTWPRLGATAVLAAIPLVLALPLANTALHAKRSGVELSLVIYDLGGIGAFARTDVFPRTGVSNPVAVNADCYSPISWDRYAWWGAAPCAIGFTTLAAPLKTGHGPYGWWAAAVAANPLAYAGHRLAHFDRNTRFLVHDADLPGLSRQSDPNPWSFTVAPNGWRSALQHAADALLTTPPGWPICWLALGLGLLVLRPRLGGADPAVALAWSAVLYGFSYLPLSVASEVRYHFWTMTAVGIAAALVLSQRATWRLPRWQLALAAAPLLIVVAAGVIARA
ncbi:hypothetical protein [Sphingomonas sp. AAP5]|uniref:hypothetical protein n=1 Tax=Sphingomonas sp. AAP5 TaxID=1523415 RepID=UPI001F0E1C73|nr:hypothetical protein [Sphingomonas sp. AAP5]